MDNLSLPRTDGKQLLVSSMVSSKSVTIAGKCYNCHVFGVSGHSLLKVSHFQLLNRSKAKSWV